MAKKGEIPSERLMNRVVNVTEYIENMPQFKADTSKKKTAVFPDKNILWKNTSGTDCPPYGAFEVVDIIEANDRIVLSGQQLSGDETVMIGFANHNGNDAGRVAPCNISGLARALFADGDGSNGTEYGPKASSWELEEGSGFKSLGTVPNKPGQMFVVPAADEGPAKWIVFELDEALATTDATVDVTVIAYYQGSDPDPESSGLTINNHPASVDYLFEGESGAVGSAYLIDDDEYQIVQLEFECPEE